MNSVSDATRKAQERKDREKIKNREKYQRRKVKQGKQRTFQYIVIGMLLFAPMSISIISAIHLFSWFSIGNNPILAGVLAGAFEYFSIVSLAALIELNRLPKLAVYFIWGIIAVLVSLQVVGNVYSAFTYILINSEIATNAAKLFGAAPGIAFNRGLAWALGLPLSLTAIPFIKILSEYWKIVQAGNNNVYIPVNGSANGNGKHPSNGKA